MWEFLSAEAGIRQLHARYTDAVWRKDYQAFGECFAPDAEWRIAGLVLRGRPAIVAALQHFMARFRSVLVTLRTPILEVSQGTASGRTYLSEQSVLNDGAPYAVIGVYFERFVLQADRWQFSWRLFQTHSSGPLDEPLCTFQNPDYGAPPAMPPLDAIPVNHSKGAANSTQQP